MTNAPILPAFYQRRFKKRKMVYGDSDKFNPTTTIPWHHRRRDRHAGVWPTHGSFARNRVVLMHMHAHGTLYPGAYWRTLTTLLPPPHVRVYATLKRRARSHDLADLVIESSHDLADLEIEQRKQRAQHLAAVVAHVAWKRAVPPAARRVEEEMRRRRLRADGCEW